MSWMQNGQHSEKQVWQQSCENNKGHCNAVASV
jgi:hypothetical protein